MDNLNLGMSVEKNLEEIFQGIREAFDPELLAILRELSIQQTPSFYVMCE